MKEKEALVVDCNENIGRIDAEVEVVAQRYANDKSNLDEEKKALQEEKKAFDEKKVTPVVSFFICATILKTILLGQGR